jgi:nicotinamide-nucleotide amidase
MSLEDLADRLTTAGLTVAVAESATGGLIAAELSRLPGSSAYFKGGIVAYDATSKTELLGIPKGLFEDHGSVSAEACKAMAEAARRLFQADFGLSETSIAGPAGATEAKPVGLSYVALASAKGTQLKESRLTGNREENRRSIAETALALLAEGLPSP